MTTKATNRLGRTEHESMVLVNSRRRTVPSTPATLAYRGWWKSACDLQRILLQSHRRWALRGLLIRASQKPQSRINKSPQRVAQAACGRDFGGSAKLCGNQFEPNDILAGPATCSAHEVIIKSNLFSCLLENVLLPTELRSSARLLQSCDSFGTSNLEFSI